MLKKLSAFNALSAGLIGGAIIVVAGTGTYFLLSKSNSEAYDVIKYRYNELRLFNEKGPFLREASSRTDDTKFWLGEKGLRKLGTMLENKLTYGPEIYSLKSITIGDDNFTEEGNNGEYIPLSSEMNIRTESMQKIVRSDGLTSESNLDIRVQMVYDVIFHEYGHHIANTYLTNAPKSMSTSTRELIYSDDHSGKRIAEAWDADFLKHFKGDLYYDNDTRKVPGVFINGPDGIDIQLKSIGSIYNQKDLFDIANGVEKPLFPKLLEHEGFKGYAFGYYKLDFPLKNSIKGDDLPYYYSMSELFTRKYQQLNMTAIGPLDGAGYLKNLGFGYTPSWWINSLKFPFSSIGNIWLHSSQMLADRNKYESLSSAPLNKRKNRDWYKLPNRTISRYLQDAPFDLPIAKKTNQHTKVKNARAKDLYKTMDRHMGHSYGADISYIWSKNDTELIRIGHAKLGFSDIENKIKFGGYISDAESKKVKYIGYFDGRKFISHPIIINDFKYKTKAAIGSYVSLPLDAKLENKFYTTADWIDIKKIKDKQLFFSATKDGFKTIKGKKTAITSALKTIRSSQDAGIASTWVNTIIRRRKYNTFAAINKGGKIMIGDSKWT